MSRPTMPPQRGFTLVEAVLVIMVVGVLSAIVAVFIRKPVQAYVDSVGRAELTDQADLAMQRMARELRRALPNSVRVTDGTFVEFMLTRTGGRYLALEDGVGGNYLYFSDPANSHLTFSVVGASRNFSTKVDVGNFVVVDNMGPTVPPPTDAYQFGPNCDCNIARISAITRDASNLVQSITLADNPFGRQSTPSPSLGQRFQVVSGPVMYACKADGKGAFTLSRYSGYTIRPNLAGIPADFTQEAIVATGVDTCSNLFRYNQGAQRAGLVILTLTLRARNQADPPVRLVDQVHVDNTP
jgi:MSHA biogenesis protein MshO